MYINSWLMTYTVYLYCFHGWVFKSAHSLYSWVSLSLRVMYWFTQQIGTEVGTGSTSWPAHYRFKGETWPVLNENLLVFFFYILFNFAFVTLLLFSQWQYKNLIIISFKSVSWCLINFSVNCLYASGFNINHHTVTKHHIMKTPTVTKNPNQGWGTSWYSCTSQKQVSSKITVDKFPPIAPVITFSMSCEEIWGDYKKRVYNKNIHKHT